MNGKYRNMTFAFLLGIVGCGDSGPEIASVEGTVTMDGQPLANASVVFSPPSGRPAGAKTDEAGHYTLNFSGGRKGAIPGKNTIRISTLSDGGLGDDGTRLPGTPETVPVQYNTQSTLEFVVEDGKANTADFAISSEGEVVEASKDDDN